MYVCVRSTYRVGVVTLVIYYSLLSGKVTHYSYILVSQKVTSSYCS